jgi:hypothetical protein
MAKQKIEDIVFAKMGPEDRALAQQIMEDMQKAFLPHMTANNMAFHNRFSAMYIAIAFTCSQFIASMGGTVLANNGTDPEDVQDKMEELSQIFQHCFAQDMGLMIAAITEQYKNMVDMVEKFRDGREQMPEDGQFRDVDGTIFEVKSDRVTMDPPQERGKSVH